MKEMILVILISILGLAAISIALVIGNPNMIGSKVILDGSIINNENVIDSPIIIIHYDYLDMTYRIAYSLDTATLIVTATTIVFIIGTALVGFLSIHYTMRTDKNLKTAEGMKDDLIKFVSVNKERIEQAEEKVGKFEVKIDQQLDFLEHLSGYSSQLIFQIYSGINDTFREISTEIQDVRERENIEAKLINMARDAYIHKYFSQLMKEKELPERITSLQEIRATRNKKAIPLLEILLEAPDIDEDERRLIYRIIAELESLET